MFVLRSNFFARSKLLVYILNILSLSPKLYIKSYLLLGVKDKIAPKPESIYFLGYNLSRAHNLKIPSLSPV